MPVFTPRARPGLPDASQPPHPKGSQKTVSSWKISPRSEAGPALRTHGDFLTLGGKPFLPVRTNYFSTDANGWDFSGPRNGALPGNATSRTWSGMASLCAHRCVDAELLQVCHGEGLRARPTGDSCEIWGLHALSRASPRHKRSTAWRATLSPQTGRILLAGPAFYLKRLRKSVPR